MRRPDVLTFIAVAFATFSVSTDANAASNKVENTMGPQTSSLGNDNILKASYPGIPGYGTDDSEIGNTTVKQASKEALSPATFQPMTQTELRASNMTDGLRFLPEGAKAAEWEISTNIPGLDLHQMDLKDMQTRIQRLVDHYPTTKADPSSAANPLNTKKEQDYHIFATPQKWIDGSFGHVVDGQTIIQQMTIDDSDATKTVLTLYLNLKVFFPARSNPHYDLAQRFDVNYNIITGFYVLMATRLDPSLRNLIDPMTPVLNIILTKDEIKTGSWAGIVDISDTNVTTNDNISILSFYNPVLNGS